MVAPREPVTQRPTQEELAAFLEREFPQTPCRIVSLSDEGATLRHEVGLAELRPGGTVSGPTMMALADVSLYVAIMARVGLLPMIVTTQLSFNFLRKPAGDRALIGVCRLLKVGRTLAVGEASVYSEGLDDPVAHAVGSYAIPSTR
ncbi:PaaI family thioesterase [Hylemonella sp. W303a]|uniref:PaaI family thioesterase n=1 Tax=Hylemonella sp. W303a TaxID=3389873 RepID=UPI00396B0FA0